jgi:homoserine dehydrogenase
MRTHLNIGLFGFGCVGQGLYTVLHQARGLKEAKISKICVKHRDKKRSLPAEFFTYDREDILDNQDINLVVELIDNADDAFEIVREAMLWGKPVVSANKKMIAEHFDELLDLQNKCGVPFLYEASCGGSIPIIRNLEEYYDNDLLNGVEGILNGTTNYILTKMFEGGESYLQALSGAQQLGFAESNPRSDVGGFDAKYKLCILTAHAFGVFIKPENVFNYGIETVLQYDFQYAREKGYHLKLVAQSRRIGDELTMWVMPQFVNADHKLYQVANEYNGVEVEGVFSDKQFFWGKGAGSFPTGSAVLSDISAITYNYRYEYKKIHQNTKPPFNNTTIVRIYCRFQQEDFRSLFQFQTIEEQYIGKTHQYIIGTVSLQYLMESDALQSPDVFIALVPNTNS